MITLNRVTRPKTPQTCCNLSITCQQVATNLQQLCQNQACYNHMLQVIETTRNKAVDNKFWQSTYNIDPFPQSDGLFERNLLKKEEHWPP